MAERRIHGLAPRASRQRAPLRADRIEWKGSVIALGPTAVGTYSVRVIMRRFDVDPAKPSGNVPVEMRPPFTAEIEVRADAETRIEVR